MATYSRDSLYCTALGWRGTVLDMWYRERVNYIGFHYVHATDKFVKKLASNSLQLAMICCMVSQFTHRTVQTKLVSGYP